MSSRYTRLLRYARVVYQLHPCAWSSNVLSCDAPSVTRFPSTVPGLYGHIVPYRPVMYSLDYFLMPATGPSPRTL
ncbi:hypothetical protein CBR_g22313 [Chara braunii]|uniref:Uncharacterized protein n=1 Tax=Chara braunii TaxID=69332 RepID=A0A388L2N1_CHABU|nr:hypothetical protein CBR_g22313 [Chara braunii]|eukprot:GBG76565.1 hypothetical protein CBR_g22313 [Chara braunii]